MFSFFRQYRILSLKNFWNVLSVICKDTKTPPVVVSCCSESVLDCQGYVNTWTTAGNSSCPKCHSEDDFIAINLKGFQILTKINSSFTWTG